MPLFRFKVADKTGIISETVIEGESQGDAVRRLKVRRLTPVDFLGEGEGQSSNKNVFKRSKVNAIMFTDRLVPLLDAGIPLEKSLAIIEDTMDDEESAKFIRDMRQGLHEGRKFSQLISDRNNVFPRIYENVVAVGEEAGALPIVLGQMRDYLNEKKEMRNFIIGASIYPAVIGFVSFSVVLFLLGFIVPKFATVFNDGKRVPEGVTALLLNISYAVQNYWYIIFAVMALLIIVPIYMFRSEKYSDLLDRILIRIPIIGKIVVISNIATLVKTMSVMIKSGVHLLQAVQISARVIPNFVIRDSIASVASRLRQGERLSHALAQSKYLPKMVIKMLAVGEETGGIEEMMERVGGQYDKELKVKIKALLSIFEPLVIVILGGIIGFIVVTMFLAISDAMEM